MTNMSSSVKKSSRHHESPLRKGRYARFVSGLRWGVRYVALECGSPAPALGGRSRASPPAWQQAAQAPVWLAHSKSVCPPCMPLSPALIVNLSATEHHELTSSTDSSRLLPLSERIETRWCLGGVTTLHLRSTLVLCRVTMIRDS